jgi:hypothetical protein
MAASAFNSHNQHLTRFCYSVSFVEYSSFLGCVRDLQSRPPQTVERGGDEMGGFGPFHCRGLVTVLDRARQSRWWNDKVPSVAQEVLSTMGGGLAV